MLIKALATSALVLGMATSAMAQSSDMWSWWHHDRPVPNERTVPVDPYTTGSIRPGSHASGLNSLGNPGPSGPCASNTPGPDANAGQNVNDQYCGK
ncbi:hypothetical protein [Mesorhizobium sp.]|uniref:hypothetical protein n=1 Tax=Mesorhizobium sp. TaxID=1871066 RepID=UPI000FE30E18|nr:hypothetical protein [Mesorhizobium sp.]RWA74891.1 MAG: hypothetical protein EOQ28_12195 [Mesorhizobium sp.]RWC02833.1 MAG: hypothetical protein EOQ57_09675 [Mesorhizobium sp.]RWG81007.1 MAG: hypothetical protein EOQ69_19710 [Mesorhizobium sp.]RWG89733.1 MAG: hypothetical protein EOQ70_06680 [Mesorhizobium sp.]RWK08635.1 MAG: hypothetical protein EOR42_05125 [Mesorhizobium sp.]